MNIEVNFIKNPILVVVYILILTIFLISFFLKRSRSYLLVLNFVLVVFSIIYALLNEIGYIEVITICLLFFLLFIVVKKKEEKENGV